MPSHEEKDCARCGAPFECKAGSITICQCYAVPLNAEQRAYVRERFEDCLCAACLKELRDECAQNDLDDF